MRRQIVATIVLLLAALVAPATASAAADVCYQNEDGRIITRRRPGYTRVPCPGEAATDETPVVETEGQEYQRRGTELLRRPTAQAARRTPNAISPIPRPTVEDYVARIPVPDRWRIVDTIGYQDRWYDPYNRNTLKADNPVHGDWFFSFGLISDSVVELRDLPTPVGGNSTDNAGQIDVFGSGEQLVAVENLVFEFVYYKGDTVFRPPDWEFRFTPVINVNRVELDEILGVNVDPRDGSGRRHCLRGGASVCAAARARRLPHH